MSAYGEIVGPSRPTTGTLAPRVYPLADPQKFLTVFPLHGSALPDDLAQYLNEEFNAVVAEGKTYPQEQPLDAQAFRAYYLSSDVFLGVLTPTRDLTASPESDGAILAPGLTLNVARANNDWSACIAGMYYVKPNYPGRSSHNCNAGFVVPPHHRGLKAGVALGRSFLYYAPRLGYRASVFNLVYVSNIASLRIWDQLGFQRVGLVPEAGRLKAGKDGEDEDYVDAVVYYKKFDEVS